MKYMSICSGIEAATQAWHPLGWEPAAFSEIEKFPRQVLAHHYPHVPLHGDFTTIKGDEYGPVELLVGGTPCQSFSVAGLRKGLADPRGNLMLEYGALAKRLGAKWLVWENVPGVLSANGGRDFGTFLGMLAELGYGFAYRVLDAQYFGVAQRRRRVFVVGCLGDWRSAAAVLFEQHSLQGHPAPRREKREVSPTIPSRSTGGGGLGTDFDLDVGLIQSRQWPADVCSTLDTTFGTKQGLEDQHVNAGCPMFVPATTHTLRGAHAPAIAFGVGEQPDVGHCLRSGASKADKHESTTYVAQVVHGTQDPCVSDIAFAQGRNNGGENVLVHAAVGTDCFNGSLTGDVAATMGTRGSSTNASGPTVMQAMQVRRLTPEECEALQGFPRSYTDIKPNGKPTPDGQRYKALGNSMAVPVMRWIGERIQITEGIKNATN